MLVIWEVSLRGGLNCNAVMTLSLIYDLFRTSALDRRGPYTKLLCRRADTCTVLSPPCLDRRVIV